MVNISTERLTTPGQIMNQLKDFNPLSYPGRGGFCDFFACSSDSLPDQRLFLKLYRYDTRDLAINEAFIIKRLREKSVPSVIKMHDHGPVPLMSNRYGILEPFLDLPLVAEASSPLVYKHSVLEQMWIVRAYLDFLIAADSAAAVVMRDHRGDNVFYVGYDDSEPPNAKITVFDFAGAQVEEDETKRSVWLRDQTIPQMAQFIKDVFGAHGANIDFLLKPDLDWVAPAPVVNVVHQIKDRKVMTLQGLHDLWNSAYETVNGDRNEHIVEVTKRKVGVFQQWEEEVAPYRSI